MKRKQPIKILFRLPPEAWHGSGTETLWAEEAGPGRYRLRNSPFYAFGVSVNDIVFAEYGPDGLEFKGVSLKGGHSTYRTIVGKDVPAMKVSQAWAPLQQLGCSYEEGDGRLRSIDVPPQADIHRVYDLLAEGEKAGVWDFDEGNCEHPV